MKTAIIVLFISVLAACDPPPKYAIDKDLQVDIFQQCLKLIPKGPDVVEYNDWAEVIKECSYAAREQAYRCVANCLGKTYDMGVPENENCNNQR